MALCPHSPGWDSKNDGPLGSRKPWWTRCAQWCPHELCHFSTAYVVPCLFFSISQAGHSEEEAGAGGALLVLLRAYPPAWPTCPSAVLPRLAVGRRPLSASSHQMRTSDWASGESTRVVLGTRPQRRKQTHLHLLSPGIRGGVGGPTNAGIGELPAQKKEGAL